MLYTKLVLVAAGHNNINSNKPLIFTVIFFNHISQFRGIDYSFTRFLLKCLLLGLLRGPGVVGVTRPVCKIYVQSFKLSLSPHYIF